MEQTEKELIRGLPEADQHLVAQTRRLFQEEKQDESWRWVMTAAQWIGDRFVVSFSKNKGMFSSRRTVRVFVKDGILYPHFGDK